MAINEQKVKEFEEKYENTVFNKINEVSSKQFEKISKITENARDLGQLQVSIPNSSTTVNNKLVELSHIFQEAGISMFVSKHEENDFVSSSLVGDAIIHDLIDKLSESTHKLVEYSKKIGEVSNEKSKQVLALQNISPIRKFFLRIKALFVPKQSVDLSLTEEEQGTLDVPLQEYKEIDDQIFNYNLEDNLVQSLVKEIAGPQKIGNYINSHRYRASVVPELLEESVIPDLKKLGLEHLVPKLQETLIEEYKKDLPDPKIYQVKDEDMHLYVPDFSREKEKSHEISEEELQELHQQAEENIKSDKKTLRSMKRDDEFTRD